MTILVTGQDQKTLKDISRDYRAGLFQRNGGFQPGLTDDDFMLVASYSSSVSLSPGDIVPLKDFHYFGENETHSDDMYSDEHLFGCISRCGWFDDLSSFTEDYYEFTPIPFGIATDFITSETFGKVQTHGRCWALVEVVGDSLSVPDDNHRYVVLRKNSRHSGKPFLQTAPDGLAEVLYFGKTTASGLRWALLELGHHYHGSLWKVKDVSTDIEKRTFLYAAGPDERADSSGTTRTLYDTWTQSHPYPIYIHQDYDSDFDNYITGSSITDYVQYGNQINKYFNVFENQLVSLAPWESASSSNPGFPTYYQVDHKLSPFPGGIFTATFYKNSSESYFLLFGNKINVSQIVNYVQHIDLWNGDPVQIQLLQQTATLYHIAPQSCTFWLVSGPTDYPVGTIIPFIGGSYPQYLLQRGWEVMDWSSNFTSDIGVLFGQGTLSTSSHTHTFSYFGGTQTTVTSRTDQSDETSKTYDVPFQITLLRKVTAGENFF